MFDGGKTELYLDDIRKIIIKHWGCFENIFATKQDFDAKMQAINKLRADAHAKEISPNDMDYFRASITSIENQVADFLG